MSEESRQPEQADSETGSTGEGNEILQTDKPDDSDAQVPYGPQAMLQRALNVFMGFAEPGRNSFVNRLTPAHISQMLEIRESDARRAHESEISERRHTTWLTVWFGTLILLAAVGLIVFFGIRETYEVVTAIIGGLLGFAGGFGVARMRR